VSLTEQRAISSNFNAAEDMVEIDAMKGAGARFARVLSGSRTSSDDCRGETTGGDRAANANAARL
jgi:hypothetical protein